MNNIIEQYLIQQSKILNAEFTNIQNMFRDSDVKGGKNEKAIAEFIKKNHKSNFISIGAEIIDSFGNRTDEIDICINNNYQAFSAENQPLIAEGVDFVIQVKKTITSQEIGRLIKNCNRLKTLNRKSNNGDKSFGLLGDVPYFIDKIPYIVIAGDSQLQLSTIVNKLNNYYKENNFHLQPDAIFIINKGFIINFREGSGQTWKTHDGKKYIGFCIVNSLDKTLFEFIRYIHSLPKIERQLHPLNYYFNDKIYYNINGKLK